MRMLLAVVAVVATACSSIFGIRDPVPSTADGPPGDGPDDDAGRPDGEPPGDGGTAAAPLLLTEAVLAPGPSELVEVFNTSDQAVDLTGYFVADCGAYFQLPAGAPALDSTDFIARFPDGATIAPGGVVTVALASAADFTTAYGVAPTFSIADGTMPIVTANGTPGLTSNGEVVVLFFWDGASDLVRDADIVLAGSPSAANALIDKTGVQQDGPDPDLLGAAYADDANTIEIQAGTPGPDLSTKRIAREAGEETQDGTGNGLDGHDETTEDTSVTWDSIVFSAPTPGAVPDSLR